MLPKWAKDVTDEDIQAARSAIVQDVAEAIGIEATLRLLDALGGEMVYIPKAESVTNRARDRLILAEYNGYNLREVARRYGLSTQTVRRIADGWTRKCDKFP